MHLILPLNIGGNITQFNHTFLSPLRNLIEFDAFTIGITLIQYLGILMVLQFLIQVAIGCHQFCGYTVL